MESNLKTPEIPSLRELQNHSLEAVINRLGINPDSIQVEALDNYTKMQSFTFDEGGAIIIISLNEPFEWKSGHASDSLRLQELEKAYHNQKNSLVKSIHIEIHKGFLNKKDNFVFSFIKQQLGRPLEKVLEKLALDIKDYAIIGNILRIRTTDLNVFDLYFSIPQQKSRSESIELTKLSKVKNYSLIGSDIYSIEANDSLNYFIFRLD